MQSERGFQWALGWLMEEGSHQSQPGLQQHSLCSSPFSAAHYETCKTVLGNRLWGFFCWSKKGAGNTLQPLPWDSEESGSRKWSSSGERLMEGVFHAKPKHKSWGGESLSHSFLAAWNTNIGLEGVAAILWPWGRVRLKKVNILKTQKDVKRCTLNI